MGPLSNSTDKGCLNDFQQSREHFFRFLQPPQDGEEVPAEEFPGQGGNHGSFPACAQPTGT